MDEVPHFAEPPVPTAVGATQSLRLLFEFLDSESRDPAFDMWR